MNCNLKTKIFTASIAGNISTLLDAKARLLGVVCHAGTTTATDAASFTLRVSSTSPALNRPVANGKANTGLSTVEWWAGVDRQWKESFHVATPTNDVTNGFYPRAIPSSWTDDNGTILNLNLDIVIAGGGSVMVYYTTDNFIPSGEQI